MRRIDGFIGGKSVKATSGREGDVFSLIGPKRYDAPWKDIEAQGYIAPADCVATQSSGESASSVINEKSWIES